MDRQLSWHVDILVWYWRCICWCLDTAAILSVLQSWWEFAILVGQCESGVLHWLALLLLFFSRARPIANAIALAQLQSPSRSVLCALCCGPFFFFSSGCIGAHVLTLALCYVQSRSGDCRDPTFEHYTAKPYVIGLQDTLFGCGDRVHDFYHVEPQHTCLLDAQANLVVDWIVRYAPQGPAQWSPRYRVQMVNLKFSGYNVQRLDATIQAICQSLDLMHLTCTSYGI